MDNDVLCGLIHMCVSVSLCVSVCVWAVCVYVDYIYMGIRSCNMHHDPLHVTMGGVTA